MAHPSARCLDREAARGRPNPNSGGCSEGLQASLHLQRHLQRKGWVSISSPRPALGEIISHNSGNIIHRTGNYYSNLLRHHPATFVTTYKNSNSAARLEADGVEYHISADR